MPTDLYISVDIEADGPIPGPYSMLSFGMVTAATYDGTTFTRLEPATFYRELQPISPEFVPEALAVSGLDRAALARTGAPPALAMTENVAWLAEMAEQHRARPVLVAYPLGFDWMFTYWYQVRFTGGSPFGHSGHLDIKTLFAGKARTTVRSVGKRTMPRHLLSSRTHTHHALDDALEQAELFCNIAAWDGI
ncbi:exonuclease [Actinoplanes sp. N902-109]|uniref:exonuclease n=1 Tax=Actinoplanes sp. (strain N902-109) TaxID=649831 RepID=UPI0003295552|nr:exonuclease [Actinoplanes sp. N902-109]AGL19995.1 exonuclease [Actinoplanes sp. N902-109]